MASFRPIWVIELFQEQYIQRGRGLSSPAFLSQSSGIFSEAQTSTYHSFSAGPGVVLRLGLFFQSVSVKVKGESWLNLRLE